MMPINVLLAGTLKIDGYGQGHTTRKDGAVRVWMPRRCTVTGVMETLGVPADRVAMTMLNGRQCPATVPLHRGDRVILIPQDVAMLWRALGRQNLGLGIGYDS